MERQRLGLTRAEISRVGFGCWALGGHGYGNVDDKESIAAIREALHLGIDLFDTADVYGFGHSERILSKALGAERTKVTIATKFGVGWDAKGKTYRDCSPTRLVDALHGSLRRLRIEAIPLYQIHWHDNKTPLPEILYALKKCQEAGKIIHIGCTNFSWSQLCETTSVRMEAYQVPYNILQREYEECMDKCHNELNASVVAYNVLARGLFSGKYDGSVRFGENDTRMRDATFGGDLMKKYLRVVDRLRKTAVEWGKTPGQLAIRWALQNPNVSHVIVGAKNKEQVRENAGALGWDLPASYPSFDDIFEPREETGPA